MRMETWRLAQTLPSGDPAQVQAQVALFDQGLNLLRTGNPSRPLFVPKDRQTQRAFADVQSGWIALRENGRVAGHPHRFRRDSGRGLRRSDRPFVTAIENRLAGRTTMLNAFQFVTMALALRAPSPRSIPRTCSSSIRWRACRPVWHRWVRATSRRACEGGDDEFGALADGFNRMANTLQGLYQSLESRSRRRHSAWRTNTRGWRRCTRRRLRQRATSLDALAQGFARQVRASGGGRCLCMRWSDESNQRYLLLASDCLPQALVEAEHCVPTGDCFCGQAQGESHTQVIPIRPTPGVACPATANGPASIRSSACP